MTQPTNSQVAWEKILQAQAELSLGNAVPAIALAEEAEWIAQGLAEDPGIHFGYGGQVVNLETARKRIDAAIKLVTEHLKP